MITINKKGVKISNNLSNKKEINNNNKNKDYFGFNLKEK